MIIFGKEYEQMKEDRSKIYFVYQKVLYVHMTHQKIVGVNSITEFWRYSKGLQNEKIILEWGDTIVVDRLVDV